MTRLEEYDNLRILNAPSSTDDAARQTDLYTDENARDALAAALEATGEASIAVDDAGDTITVGATDTDTFPGLTDVQTGTLANRPAAGTAGLWYFTTDNNGVFVDDGANWQLIAENPANIAAGDLGFDPATQTELDNQTTDGIDIENTDGTTLLSEANPIQAGADLSWGDDGDGSATLDYVGSGGSGSSVTEVTDASNLQSALDNNSVVRVVGYLSLSAGTTITVPQTTELYGYGYAQSGAATGDCIVGSVDGGPVLSLEGGNAQVYGIGVRNSSTATDANGDPTGIGVRMRDYTQRLRFVDVGALGGGILLDTDPNASSNPTEPKIEHCRVGGNSDLGDGAVGIDNQTHYDLKLHGCIIRGYDVSVRVSNDAAIISGNHTYPHPADDSSGNVEHTLAFDIDANSIRMYGNRVDGGPTDACVLLESTWNSVVNCFFESNGDQTEGPCDGIRFKSGNSATNCIISNNRFTVIGGSGGGTCIDASPVNNNLQECDVSGNTADRSAYDSLGHINNKSGANASGNPPEDAIEFFPGQIVENTNDNSFWVLTSADTWEQIDVGDSKAFTLAGEGSAGLGTSGETVVDTGVPVDTTSHFVPVPSPPDGVDVTMSLEYDSATSSNYLLHIEQNTTSTESVSVGWQLMESNL